MRLKPLVALAALAPSAAFAADFSGTWRITNADLAADRTLKGSVLRNGSPSPIAVVKQ
jgi:hypothetical protein